MIDLKTYDLLFARLLVRHNFDNRYFNDRFEGLPVDGYTATFEQLLNHPNITIQLGTDFFELKSTRSKIY